MPMYRAKAPALGTSLDEGVSSLAQAFAPPKATDVYAYAKAKSERESASRLADLMVMARDPNVNPTVFANQAGIAGAFTPSQSLEAVDRNNATTLRTNALDNRTKLQQTSLEGESALAKAYAAPVILNEGQTATLPQQTQVATGLPGTIAGAFTLKPGEVSNRPDGRTVAGPAKPLTDAEVKGAILGGMPRIMQEAITFGSTPLQTIMGENGPVLETGPQSVGKTPHADATKAQLFNYKTKEGRTGTARFGGEGVGFLDAQTGEKLPGDGLQTFTASLQGGASDTGLGKATEAQGRAGYAMDMVEGATRDILSAFDTGKLPTRTDTALRSASETVPSLLGPSLTNSMSPEGQVFFQNVRTALPMQLLTQSGQGVTEREYERKMAELVPVAGEAPAVTQAKRRQFAAYADAVKRLAGPAGVRPSAAPAANAAPSAGTAENTIIENDAGQRMIRRGGKWEPYNG